MRTALHVHTLECTPTRLIYQMHMLLPSPQLNIAGKLRSLCWIREPLCCQWSKQHLCVHIHMCMCLFLYRCQREGNF